MMACFSHFPFAFVFSEIMWHAHVFVRCLSNNALSYMFDVALKVVVLGATLCRGWVKIPCVDRLCPGSLFPAIGSGLAKKSSPVAGELGDFGDWEIF
jgi:hypothetical protein